MNMDMDEVDDWDLNAVVRSCSGATTTTRDGGAATTTTTTTTTSFKLREDDNNNNFVVSFQDLSSPRFFNTTTTTTTTTSAFDEELHNLYKPFVPKSPPLAPPQPPPQLLSPPAQQQQQLPLQDLFSVSSPQQILKQQHLHQLNTRLITHTKQSMSLNGSTTSTSTQSPRTKRRKNQLKKVCQVPAESLSSDMWSWRKYGQKPIKGSPYPRGYYRCSTSKGCMARKQVERNRSDPSMFIVTYTAEHNHPMPTHRNSLAGSTRQKPATGASGDSNKPTCSSPESSPAWNSPATEKPESSREEIFDDDDEEFGVSNMALDNLEPDDDFFEGLEELAGADAGDYSSENFPTGTMQFPWLTNNATTTAAGGG